MLPNNTIIFDFLNFKFTTAYLLNLFTEESNIIYRLVNWFQPSTNTHANINKQYEIKP
jgi:hypothetical protein